VDTHYIKWRIIENVCHRSSPMQSRYFIKGKEGCSNSLQLVAAGDEKEGMAGLA
jgi:hypothetical protein